MKTNKRHTAKQFLAGWFICSLGLMLALTAHAQKQEITLATILPRDLPQDYTLRKMAEDWQKASGGRVTVKIAPGGMMDGEARIVKKLNSRNYQAALLSAVGLSEIDPDVAALQMLPLKFRSWEEVDFVRERLRPRLEQQMLKKGYVVLFWADAGWVNFFSTTKATTPDEFRDMKLFSWAGSAQSVALMKSVGYKPVEMETDNIYTGFATGMIDAAPIAPIFAQGVQIPKVARHVVNVKWAPIVGAGIIRKDVWDKLDPELKKKLLAISDRTGVEIRASGRRFHEEALASIAKGPKTHVYNLTAQEQAQWEVLAAQLGEKVRGKMVPASTYDEVQNLLREFRQTKVAQKK